MVYLFIVDVPHTSAAEIPHGFVIRGLLNLRSQRTQHGTESAFPAQKTSLNLVRRKRGQTEKMGKKPRIPKNKRMNEYEKRIPFLPTYPNDVAIVERVLAVE